MLAFGFLLIGILSRVIIHIPNFTPIIALSLFSGAYFPRKYAIFFPLVLMILSDIIIGFHSTILFTWGSVILLTFLGIWLKNNKSPKIITISSLAASVIFFFITNFGTWLMGDLYPLTAEGLKECFILAIPFFRATLSSTLVYSALFFGIYELLASRLQQGKLAGVLLIK